MTESTFSLACPKCGSLLDDENAATKKCRKDGLTFHRVDGIWRMVLPEREEYFSRFIRDYETVRRAEGRGSHDKAYYANLPYRDLSGRMSADWRIRAKSFDAFLKHVIVPMEKNTKRPLQILDLGAGNGWLSNRLALRGHHAAAIDLTVNDFDGLGCYRFYDSKFLPVQAEFDYLPFFKNSADVILFNASLHYSTNIEQTLRETLRVLNQSSLLAIIDSPVYRDASSGEQMVSERETQFAKQYGFASNNLPSENYLTYTRLSELADKMQVQWKIITPFYSLQWSIRPWIAKLLHRREPAKFHVIVGKIFS